MYILHAMVRCVLWKVIAFVFDALKKLLTYLLYFIWSAPIQDAWGKRWVH